MQYSPRHKPPATQLHWAKIWINNLIEHNRWTHAKSVPIGYYIYLNLDDE